MLFKPVDRPARVDAFELAQEAFGETFPSYEELNRSSGKIRTALIEKCARLEMMIAERYDHDAIFAWNPFAGEISLEVISLERKMIGDSKAIIGMVPSVFWAIEIITDHMAFSVRLAEDMRGLHIDAERMLERGIRRVHELADAGADVAYVPNDQAFNSGTYLPPKIYEELVLPYAQKLFSEIRKTGLIGIYHTDGNIMSILDMICATGAHGLQSIDPMAGMDIKKVKEQTYGKLALVGNVQCNLLQEGPEDAIRMSARYCLEHASPGSGYVFMASNSIFPGMPLSNYHIMQDEYRKFCEERESVNGHLSKMTKMSS